MKQKLRSVCYDEDLQLEAYHFSGVRQTFPNHFHDYYVIGLIEAGTRRLSCKNKEYMVVPGDILLFHPHDNHGCEEDGGGTLDYRGLNLSKETMCSFAEEITGEKKLPGFSQNVVKDDGLTCALHTLHQMIMDGAKAFEKEEVLLFFLSGLFDAYGQALEACITGYRKEIELACALMEQSFEKPLTLGDLCACSNLSKSTLLRAFTKAKGVTPYRYLQAIRIGKAKQLLEDGVAPVDAGLLTGFSDQSHFSNSFTAFIGLSPAAYGRIFQGDAHGK